MFVRFTYRSALLILNSASRLLRVLFNGQDANELHAHRAYEASRRRYGEGLDDLTATLTAEQTWRRIRLALTTERVDTLRRAVRTYKALGGGWNYAGGGAG